MFDEIQKKIQLKGQLNRPCCFGHFLEFRQMEIDLGKVLVMGLGIGLGLFVGPRVNRLFGPSADRLIDNVAGRNMAVTS